MEIFFIIIGLFLIKPFAEIINILLIETEAIDNKLLTNSENG